MRRDQSRSSGDREAQPPLTARALTQHALLHVAFWLVYFGFRTAAALSAGAPPAEAQGFPFLLNRAFVVASYAVATGALLALFLWRSRAPAHWRYALLIVGVGVLMPVMHFAEEQMPLILGASWEGATAALLDYAFMYGWALLLWATAQIMLDYHHRVIAQAGAINRAQSLAHDAQLRMLHYQINPHFLFNTLNAISTLVLERRNDQAEAMLLRLSGFLRYSLDRNPHKLAPLSVEIEAQRKYLEIEQTRFGDRLAVHFEIAPDAAAAHLPSLILQPLLENAIKHAVTPSGAGGRIDVSAWRDGDLLRVRVEDDGPGLPPNGATRRGVGLANARERLKLNYGDRAGLTAGNRPQGGCVIEFWLPFEREDVLEPTLASPVGG